ncbi:MAG: DUF3267 domain-containing protein [Bacillota bacterium]|jgi:hypothetical protein|nr:DUF3267 domain-containing protein [Bacillota bacterium]HHU43273.1 DUF3267 domain-containing protein [Clostridiales bacterium]
MEYKKQIVAFDAANIINLSLVMFLLSYTLFSILNIFVFDFRSAVTGKFFIDLIVVIALGFLFVIVHELLHALGFIIFGKAKPSDIKFGVVPKHGMVYCSCKKPMPKKAYMLALIFPVILTGLIPIIFVTIWGNLIWIFLFAVMVSGGAGDLMMFKSLTKYDKDQLIMDHPNAPAYYLLYPKGQEPEGFVEATPEQEQFLIEQMKTSPFEGENKKKNLALKILKILFFLAASVIVLTVVGVILFLSR